MKSLAIISEYNPFHNGHRYQLEKAKELTGADYAITLMSGNFLQRGEPAYWNKYTRSTMALYGGLDLALELPFCYATGSARDFAMGAVSILNSLNSVDYLCFGAESDDFKLFDKISDILINESTLYTSILKDALKQGHSYAKARSLAISGVIKDEDVNQLLNQPNNILALEYICALKRTNSEIEPVIIKRKNAGYNDKNIYESISSASAVRTALEAANLASVDRIAHDVPESTLEIIKNSLGASSPVYAEDLSPFLISCLMLKSTSMSANGLCGDFSDICDINEDISTKLNKLSYPTDYTSILDSLSSRQYTLTRLNRGLLHLILNYTDQKRETFIKAGYACYANILGIKQESSSCLRQIKKSSSIPLITKKADFEKNLGEYENVDKDTAKTMWQLDIMSTRLYNQLVFNRYGTVLNDDFTCTLPII
jgi:predicted nucleotidyltransferase